MYDFTTTNESFIKVADELRKLGIKNFMMPLLLYDKSLQGVDPFSEYLTLEQQVRIQNEVRLNVWYYLRECVRIPESGGFKRYEANRGNVAQTFCLTNNIDVIQNLPRQNGKTIGAVSNYSWIYHFTTINTNMIFSNKQLNDSQLNIKRFNDITKALPKFLLSHLDDKKDTDNLNLIRCDRTNNTILALSTAKDVAAADSTLNT